MPDPGLSTSHGFLGRLLRLPRMIVRFVLQRPGRTFAIIVALALVVLGGNHLILMVLFQRHLEAARQEVERGHNAAAAYHLAACRSFDPHHPETLLLSSAVARRSGAWDDADDFLAIYSREKGDDDALAFERLLLRASRGELESSAPRLVSIIESNGPQARAARGAVVTGLLQRFRWLEAERILDAWLAAAPDDTAALLLHGKFLEQRQNVPEAINNFLRVVELDPDHDEARLRAAGLLLQQRRSDDLFVHASVLRTRLPRLAEVRMLWVKALALQGRSEESRAALDECLAEFPDYAPAQAERGIAALQSGDDATAAEYLGRATQLAPGDLVTRSQYVAVLSRLGRTVDAERERESLRSLQKDVERISELVSGPLQLHPNDPSIPHEIATIALRSGQAAEGLRWLQAALLIDPNHGPTHQVLANYYQASGNPALAARHRAMARQYNKKQ